MSVLSTSNRKTMSALLLITHLFRRAYSVLLLLISVHERATISVCSPPPCGEGLGVGVHQWKIARPPPRRFAPTLPTRGRGNTELAARIDSSSPELALPSRGQFSRRRSIGIRASLRLPSTQQLPHHLRYALRLEPVFALQLLER